jgi:hypothetical protein
MDKFMDFALKGVFFSLGTACLAAAYMNFGQAADAPSSCGGGFVWGFLFIVAGLPLFIYGGKHTWEFLRAKETSSGPGEKKEEREHIPPRIP